MGQERPFKPTEFIRIVEHKLTDMTLFLQPLSSHKLTTFLHHSESFHPEKPPSRKKKNKVHRPLYILL